MTSDAWCKCQTLSWQHRREDHGPVAATPSLFPQREADNERLLAEIRLLRTIIDQATEDRREIVRNARVNMDALNAENNLLRAAATALCEAVEAYDGYLARGEKGLVASMTSDMFRANAALRETLASTVTNEQDGLDIGVVQAVAQILKDLQPKWSKRRVVKTAKKIVTEVEAERVDD